MALPSAVRVAVLLVPLLPAGCKLIDQRTFQRAGQSPAPGQLATQDYAARAIPPPPLVVIRFGNPGDPWQAPLRDAARAARGRKPDVVFDVVTPVPLAAPREAQDEAARTGAADATEVATALQADGVSADRIRIGSRGDRGNPPRQVEVYVR